MKKNSDSVKTKSTQLGHVKLHFFFLLNHYKTEFLVMLKSYISRELMSQYACVNSEG